MSKPIDYGDENQVAELKKKFKSKEEVDEELLRVTLATYAGRAVIWRLLSDCKLFESVAIVNDMAHMASAQSRQNFAKELLARVLTASVGSFNIMRDEAIIREERAK
jgi:hypothetical protein